MSVSVHPLDQFEQEQKKESCSFLQSVPDLMNNSSSSCLSPLPLSASNTAQTPSPPQLPFTNSTTITSSSPPIRHQQRAYSVTAMPSELQKSVLRHQEAEHHERLRHNQPWWQYYYQLYHYQLPPGRKPTVFGPYLLLQTLGEGEFGKVKFGIEIKSGQEAAIKLIRKDSIDSASRMTKVEREISVLRILKHPNIVELIDVIETEKYIGIILQCATGGELFDYILAHRYLKEKDASRLFAQLMSGVHYMHQRHIVHRDLKLENLLLDKDRNVLITDFGFANQFASAQDDLMSTSCGSPCYAAPELVMNHGVYVGPAVDIWSCGVILFAMLCGYLPYDDDPANPESYNINLLYKYILNTPLIFPDYISEEACDLMSLMLVPDPGKRCSMEAIMNHPWLSAYRHLFVDIEEESNNNSSRQQQDILRDLQVNERQSMKHRNEPLLPQQQQQQQQNTTTTDMMTEKQPEEEVAVVPDTDKTMVPEDEEEKTTTKDENSLCEKTATTTSEIPQSEPVLQQEQIVATTAMLVEEEEPNSPLPSASPKPPTSTEKVLHFLSGQSDTTSGNTSEKHMSSPPPTLLESKFISSIKNNNNNNNNNNNDHHNRAQQPSSASSSYDSSTPTSTTTTPLPNISHSTPHPNKKTTKPRQVRLSTITPSQPPSSAPPSSTRRKTLSLFVNSMADNSKLAFSHRRQSNHHRVSEAHARNTMIPSISEHTIHTTSEKEKHKSAGKKIMDWFKKKPLSTVQRSSQTALHRESGSMTDSVRDAGDEPVKLRIHHGAVDQEALTSRAPVQVFAEVKEALTSLGLDFKRDGSEYKLKCTRPKQPGQRNTSRHRKVSTTAIAGVSPHQTPFRMLLRRTSGQPTSSNDKTKSLYGDPNVDPGDEVRFSVELCKIKNLPGLYIVDMRRLRGNVWAYKFIYRALLDTLKLGGKGSYLNTTRGDVVVVVDEEQQRLGLAATSSNNNTQKSCGDV
ncbi:MAG: kinase-like domain-containing protein [Benjaminiella poitrasii]|nr:MAG: kinase-like domain-containing protein [Benjaminiella poitrasii]